MRNTLFINTILATSLALTACASHTSLPGHINTGFAKENWFQQMHDPSQHWVTAFKEVGIAPKHIPNFTIMNTKTAAFTRIDVQGDYPVQILGHTAGGRIEIVGNQQQVQAFHAHVKDGTLYLSTAKNAKPSKQLLIRVAAESVNQVVNHGNGTIAAANLRGNALKLINKGNGNMIVIGPANVKQVTVNKRGSVAVLNAYATGATLLDRGAGNIDMAGKYDIKAITNQGTGSISVKGMHSKSLTINSVGSGSTSLLGYANVKSINHRGSGDVYCYWTASNALTIHASGTGYIGLAGTANNVQAFISGKVIFGGRYLHAKNLTVKTSANSHANVSASDQLFASASNDSQVFYFYQPKHLMKYTHDSGIIFRIDSLAPMPIAKPKI